MKPSSPATTICALASGPPPAGIGVIRVSGPAVQGFAKTCLDKPLPPAHMARLRKLIDQDGDIVDEALTLFMPAGASYTGEDVLELRLHGGAAVIEHALETLTCFKGIRLAEPGEFTRRAFEAGRMDLTQAEGIADLIVESLGVFPAPAVIRSPGTTARSISSRELPETLCLCQEIYPLQRDAKFIQRACVLSRVWHVLSRKMRPDPTRMTHYTM